MNNHNGNENQDPEELINWLLGLLGIFISIVFFIIFCFFWYQEPEFWDKVTSEDVLKFLQFLGTGFGGVAILFNVYYAAKRATAMDKTASAAEKNIEVAQNSQITERFTKAIEQLGSENLSIRLGGIYALEKIAEDAPETYHWTIMEILCAFIRNHELSIKKKEELEKEIIDNNTNDNSIIIPEDKLRENIVKKNRDLQVALMVIGRRNINHDPENSLVDLRFSNLSYTHLDNGDYNFSKAFFYECNFTGSKWNKVNLEAAFLTYSDLTNSLFYQCNLTGANLETITVTKAKFNSSNLQKAKFEATKTFGEAGFRKANLKGTDFSFCDNLTEREIKAAIGDETTILPDHLTIPESWKNKQNTNQ